MPTIGKRFQTGVLARSDSIAPDLEDSLRLSAVPFRMTGFSSTGGDGIPGAVCYHWLRMKIANSITNQYQHFQVLNLSQLVHKIEGRGPFMVTQDGCDPSDPAMRQCSFVLTRRGTWLHFYLYLALPETVRQQCTHFETIAEVLHRAESLSPKAIVEDATSLQEMIREAGFQPAPEDATGQALLSEMKRRHAVSPE
jgi:hypothetical protein